MKNRLLISFAILLGISSCLYSQEQITNSKETKFKLYYVNLSIMTPIRVDCQSFEEYFRETYKTNEIVSDRLAQELNNLEEIDENYNPYPDTRIKIEIMSGNDQKGKICVGNLVVRFNGKSYKNNENFKHLLDQVTK